MAKQYEREFSEEEIDGLIKEHRKRKSDQLIDQKKSLGYNGIPCRICGQPTRRVGQKYQCDNCGSSSLG